MTATTTVIPTLDSLTEAARRFLWTEQAAAALREAKAIIATLDDMHLDRARVAFQHEIATARQANDPTRRNMAIHLRDEARAALNDRAGGKRCGIYCPGIVPPQDVRAGISQCETCRDLDDAEANHYRCLG